MARVHRIGQTKPVHVYRLCTEGTIEERIQRRADSKLYLDQMVNRGSTAQAQALEVRNAVWLVVCWAVGRSGGGGCGCRLIVFRRKRVFLAFSRRLLQRDFFPSIVLFPPLPRLTSQHNHNQTNNANTKKPQSNQSGPLQARADGHAVVRR